MTRGSEDTLTAAAARQVLREISAALSLSAVLLAVMLGAVLVADRDVVAAIGALALGVSMLLAVLVVRRATRITTSRSAALAAEREGRERLDRTLGASRRFLETESPLDLRRQICVVARDVFECAAVSLWEVRPDSLLLLERVPWGPPYSGGDRRAISELPGLREALDASRPLFVADLAAQSAGSTRSSAEMVGAGSLLNVPIAVGGVTQLVLGLLWEEVIPEPAGAGLIAPQRFADQAGLALEQARYRAAQAEIASLNRTLSAMVQTDPLFRADGTLAEVSHAICDKALTVFEASAAALWLEAGGGIDLVQRLPATDALPPRIFIPFDEHRAFAEDLRSGQPNFIADVEHEDPVLWERFARHSRSRSQLRVPLASAGPARALMVLSWEEPVPPPTAALSAIASRFADQAGVALAEAARRQASIELAELHARFERSLLPSIALDGTGATVATAYRPGDGRLSLGGDFYDCLELPDGSLALLIGDVAGHGPAAAALGAGLRNAWRALALGDRPLTELLGGLQAVCVRERHDPYTFVTVIVAWVSSDRTELRYASAGHPAPLTLGASVVERADNGPPLGVARDAEWPLSHLTLDPAATVLLYTDGLVEGRAAPGAVERMGIGPVEERLRRIAPGDVTQADLEGLVEMATSANGAGLADDVALLALNLRRMR